MDKKLQAFKRHLFEAEKSEATIYKYLHDVAHLHGANKIKKMNKSAALTKEVGAAVFVMIFVVVVNKCSYSAHGKRMTAFPYHFSVLQLF